MTTKTKKTAKEKQEKSLPLARESQEKLNDFLDEHGGLDEDEIGDFLIELEKQEGVKVYGLYKEIRISVGSVHVVASDLLGYDFTSMGDVRVTIRTEKDKFIE